MRACRIHGRGRARYDGDVMATSIDIPKLQRADAQRRPVPEPMLRTGDGGHGDPGNPVRRGATIAAHWGPRNTILLYALTTVVGIGLSLSTRLVFHLVPPDRISIEGIAIATGSMAIGAVVGLATNQWADHRRRGRGTLAAACPRSLSGTLSLTPDSLVLEPSRARWRRPVTHVVAREQVRKVQIRRTGMLQEELAVTFADGSVACWYAPGWGSATGAFAEALRRMVHSRAGEEHASARTIG